MTMTNYIELKEISEEEQTDALKIIITDAEQKLIKYRKAHEAETDIEIKAKFHFKIENIETLIGKINQDIDQIEYPKWLLVEVTDDAENTLIDFSKLLDENVNEIVEIDNDYYEAHYSNWDGWEVMALIDSKGNIIVKDIAEYKIIEKSQIIIIAGGLKYDDYADDNYSAVIDLNGNEIISPVKNTGIRYLQNNSLYLVDSSALYDKQGEYIGEKDSYDECVNDDYIIFTEKKRGLTYKNQIILEAIYDQIKCEFDSPKFEVFYLRKAGLLGLAIFYDGEQIFSFNPQYISLFQTSIPFIFIAETAKDLPYKLLLVCNLSAGMPNVYEFNSVIEINTSLDSHEYFCCGMNTDETIVFHEKSLLSFDSTDTIINQFNIPSVDIEEIKNSISTLLQGRFEVVNTY